MAILNSREYAERKGASVCPLCGSGELSGESFDLEGKTVALEIFCNGCSASWEELYTLTGYTNLEDSKGRGVVLIEKGE